MTTGVVNTYFDSCRQTEFQREVARLPIDHPPRHQVLSFRATGFSVALSASLTTRRGIHLLLAEGVDLFDFHRRQGAVVDHEFVHPAVEELRPPGVCPYVELPRGHRVKGP